MEQKAGIWMKIRETAKEAQSRHSREALEGAAAQLFGQYGYEGVSVQDICDAAGLTKGAFYHHFSSKDEIYNRTFTTNLDLYLKEHYHVTDHADVTERMVELARCTLNCTKITGPENYAESVVSMLRSKKSTLFVRERIHTTLLEKAFEALSEAERTVEILTYSSFMTGFLVKWSTASEEEQRCIDWDALLEAGIRRLFS